MSFVEDGFFPLLIAFWGRPRALHIIRLKAKHAYVMEGSAKNFLSPATKAEREDGKEGGHNRYHTQDGMAATRKSLGLLDVSEF